ncbi:MAG: acyltransferase [Litorimonas sp.]
MSNDSVISSPQNKPIYFGALDGFRGVFALLVAVHHSAWFSYLNYRSFIDQAFVIIDLFFAFSGFLLYTLYHNKLSNRDECKAFMKRRFARLYPLHLFMLLVFIAYAGVRILANKVGVSDLGADEILPFHAGAPENWASILSNLTLTHSMGVHDYLSFNYPSWTVSVEFFTYFLFMALMVWLPPRKIWHFVLMGLGVIAIYYGLSQVPPKDGFTPKMDITYNFGFFRCVAGFFIGVIVARIYGIVRAKDLSPLRWNVTIWTLIELGMIVIGGVFLVYFQGPLQFYVGPVIFLFMLIFAFDGGAISRFMSCKPFQYLAKISYSVYMVHVIVALGFGILGPRLFPNHISIPKLLDFGAEGSGIWGDVYMVPYLITVIVISHFTYHFVERPGGKLLRNISIRKTFLGKVDKA